MSATPPSIPWPVHAAAGIVSAGRYPLDQRDFRHLYQSPTHALHLHDYAGVVRIGSGKYELVPGDATLTPAGVPSRYHLPEPGSHFCIHFRPVEAGRIGAVGVPLHLRLGPDSEKFRRQFLGIIDLHARAGRNATASAAASATLQAMLLSLAAELSEPAAARQATDAERAVRSAAALLEADLHGELDVPRLAKRVGLSQNYLARRFRQRYGVTLQQYLLRARIARAQHLLVTTDLPIKAIAAGVGMPDPQHFNKRFRAVAGCSPSDIRTRSPAPNSVPYPWSA